MIRAEQLAKRYGPIEALIDVDFGVEPGEILGFLGPNGAGKSTALRILSGYLPPTRGRASIAGHDLAKDSLAARRHCGYLPEHFMAPPELRVREYLRFRARLKGLTRREARARVDAVSERLGLGPRQRQPFGALSKGFRQRVGLADALLADPPALLLDEPFNGLDPLQRQEFRAFLRDLADAGKAVLFSSHVLPEVEALADRVLVLHEGRARAVGTLRELERLVAAHAPLVVRVEGDPGAVAVALETDGAALGATVQERRGPDLLLRLDDPGRRPALFRWLAERDFAVTEFRVQRLDLERVFRALVEDTEPQQEDAA